MRPSGSATVARESSSVPCRSGSSGSWSVATEHLRGVTRAELQAPAFAPTTVFEVLSPGDRAAGVADEIATYLAAGTALVVLVDPARRTMRPHEPERVTHPPGADDFTQASLPGSRFALDEPFATD